MRIKEEDLLRWKNQTLKIAKKLDYDKSILDFLEKNLILKVNKNKIPDGLWYGFAQFDNKKPIIEIYEKNLSCETIGNIVEEFKRKKIPEKTIKKVSLLLRIVPKKILFEVYNQCGMDHELIGFLFNQLRNKKHIEKVAVDTLLKFIKDRSGWFFHKIPWKVISVFAPIILYHHKKDEF
jgi:hypothetical protein